MHFLLNHPELIGDITDTLKLRQHDSEENVRFEVVLAIVGTAKKNFDIVAGSEELLNFVKVHFCAVQPYTRCCFISLSQVQTQRPNRKHSFQLFVVVLYTCSVSYQLVSTSLAQRYSNLALF